ncbi:Uncharacterised protein [Bordetella pertussis]|nr:Uncharacterised protein [Bordetella pertussis]
MGIRIDSLPAQYLAMDASCVMSCPSRYWPMARYSSERSASISVCICASL